MKCIEFTVWGKPVPKGRPRFYNGIAITPKETRNYEALVAKVAKKAVQDAEWDATEVCEYRVDVRVYRAAKRGDLDNFTKAVTDAMNGVVWPDDRMVEVIRAQRYDTDKQNPRVEVKVQKQ